MITMSSLIRPGIRFLSLIAVTTTLVMSANAQSPTPTPSPPLAQTAPSPAANPADVATMDATIASLYDVISGPAGKRNWDRFRSLFAPGARLIANGVRPTGEVVSRVMTPEEYAQRNGPFFEKNGFFEREAARHTDAFGNISQVFSTYESRHAMDDAKPFQRGINSIQLMNDGKRWWIVTVFWQGEDEKNPLPEKYLKSGAIEPQSKPGAVQLDSRIPTANPRKYLPITGVWPNPNVFVDLNGIYISSGTARQRLDRPDDLARALTFLPLNAWPLGRVVTFSQSSRVPIFLVKDPSPSEQAAYSNREHARMILESMGIAIVSTPVN